MITIELNMFPYGREPKEEIATIEIQNRGGHKTEDICDYKIFVYVGGKLIKDFVIKNHVRADGIYALTRRIMSVLEAELKPT